MADVTTIEIDTPTGPIDALLDVPDGPGPWPGVVVIHDAMGYGPDKESINSRVAAAGYVALTPNLFARGGAQNACPVGSGSVPSAAFVSSGDTGSKETEDIQAKLGK